MLNFRRKIENFTCGHCKTKVKGNGYTNHCPKCLFSKHVDVNPGDREELCGGIMEPVGLEKAKEGHILTHQCLKCGMKKRNHTTKNDSVEALIKLSESLAKKAMF